MSVQMFILGFFTGVTVVCLALGFVGRNPFAKKQKKPAVVKPQQPAGIRNEGLYCTCDHLSNMHHTNGHCLAQVWRDGGRYNERCNCQRYSGPMGLQELELWGPRELRNPVTAAPPRPTSKEVATRQEATELIATLMRTPEQVVGRRHVARDRLDDGRIVDWYEETD